MSFRGGGGADFKTGGRRKEKKKICLHIHEAVCCCPLSGYVSITSYGKQSQALNCGGDGEKRKRKKVDLFREAKNCVSNTDCIRKMDERVASSSHFTKRGENGVPAQSFHLVFNRIE